MATAKKVMDTAIKYLGVKEYPPDSNNVVFNTDYYGRKVSGNYPWCCAFVWDVFRMAGASSLFYGGGKTAYCPNVETWGKSNGLTVPINSGRYGDIVLFDWQHNGEADHIGFIESQKPNGSYITIEGNTAVGNDSNGGEVMYRTRYQYQICMIIRPKYTEEDDMTEEQVIKICKNVLAGWNTKESDWAKKENTIDKAKAMGITSNGDRPQGYVTREEAMQMCIKAAMYAIGEDKK